MSGGGSGCTSGGAVSAGVSGTVSGGVSRSRRKHRSVVEVSGDHDELVLLCGCDRPLDTKTSRTERNPGRDFFSCATQGRKDVYFCNTCIWVDQVMDFVAQVVDVRSSPLRQQLDVSFADVDMKQNQIRQLQTQVVELRSQLGKIKILRIILLCGFLFWFFIPNSAVAAVVAISTLAMMFLA